MTTPKAWAIFVWIAGDNNLSEYGRADIDELKKVGSSDDLDIVVQYDCSGPDGTRRYHLHHGTTLKADFVQDLGETNTGDPATAIDFFTWAMKTYPSKRVLAVLWNHGSGIDETAVYGKFRAAATGGGRKRSRAAVRSQVRLIAGGPLSRALFSTSIDAVVSHGSTEEARAIAYDDASKDFLDNIELSKVISTIAKNTGRTIDVLGFDACLMNMIEVAYQLRQGASYIVGSEETEPGFGWPYDKVAEVAARVKAPTPRALASSAAASFVASYQQDAQENRVTQSAIDLSRIDPLAQAVDKLAGACIAHIADDYPAISKSVQNALRFEMRDFVDLGDLGRQLAERSNKTAIKTAATAVRDLVTAKNGFVVRTAHKGKGVQRASGITIYFPIVGDVNVLYSRLDFAKATRWPKFIAAYQSA